MAGGYGGSPAAYQDIHEQYNGSTWSEQTDINTARQRGGTSGTTTAAILFTGRDAPGNLNAVELWNGSSWTETTEVNTARNTVGRLGTTNTAAFSVGGYLPGVSPDVSPANELWNGSSWTETTELNTVRYAMTGGGTSTSGILG